MGSRAATSPAIKARIKTAVKATETEDNNKVDTSINRRMAMARTNRTKIRVNRDRTGTRIEVGSRTEIEEEIVVVSRVHKGTRVSMTMGQVGTVDLTERMNGEMPWR